MDYLEKIEFIVLRLQKNGHPDSADKIVKVRRAASVASELLMSVTHELLTMIKSDKELKALIGKEVNGLKDYCQKIGLYVK